MHALRAVARGETQAATGGSDMGIAVVAVIHQPRFDIYCMLDNVLLLGLGGHTVYMGPAAATLDYFARLGLTCPEHVNPPDFFLDAIAGVVRTADGDKPDLIAAWETQAPPMAFEDIQGEEGLVGSNAGVEGGVGVLSLTTQSSSSLNSVDSAISHFEMMSSNKPFFSWEFARGFLLGSLLLGVGAMLVERRPGLHVHRRYGAALGALVIVALGTFSYAVSRLAKGAGSVDRYPADLAFALTLFALALLVAGFVVFAVRQYRHMQDPTFILYFTIGFANVGPLGLVYVFVSKKASLQGRLATLFGYGTQMLSVGISLVFTFWVLWIDSPIADVRCAPYCMLLAYAGGAFAFFEAVVAVVFIRRYKRLPTHDRKTAGFLSQLLLCARRGLQQLRRDVTGSLFECGLPGMSGLFLGLIYYHATYQGALLPPALQVLCPPALASLCALPLSDPIISQASLICLALSLAAVTASQRIFAREKAVFLRESAAGVSTEAYYLGKSLAHLPFTLLSPLIMLGIFYPLSGLTGLWHAM